MSALKSLGSGLVGACTLTLIHESARRIIAHAPRVDVIGMRAISKPMRAAGYVPPAPKRLHQWALAGEIISNSMYYGLVGLGPRRDVWRRGLLLGIVGGLGAVFLPRPLGLGRQPNQRAPFTQMMTVLWYTLGGLAAATAADSLKE